MGRVYATRRTAMEDALARQGLSVEGRGFFGGSSIWMRAPDHVDTTALAVNLRDKGVLIEPGHPFFHGAAPPRNYYRLAYSSIPSNRIGDGIALLAQAIRDAG